MKIATFNVNNVNRRLPNLLDWLAAERPDVACLQELKSAQNDFPRAAIEQAGYGAAWRGQKTWNGVAILARGAQPTSFNSSRCARRSANARRSNYLSTPIICSMSRRAPDGRTRRYAPRCSMRLYIGSIAFDRSPRRPTSAVVGES